MPKPWGQPNKLATGVLNAQGRINSNDLGQIGTVDPGDLSFGDASFGGNIEDGVITLQTDGSVNFGSKPKGAKPLIVWTGDDGQHPNGELGQVSLLNDTRSGEVSTELSHHGTSQSWTMNHATNSGSFWGVIEYDSQEFYLFRRTYDDFTLEEADALRLRMVDHGEDPLTGTWAEVGDVFVGQDSGAQTTITGLIIQTSGRRDYICEYEASGTPEFINGEILEWHDGQSTGQLNARDGLGFNNKVIRPRPTDGSKNVFYSITGSGSRFTAEHTPGFLHSNDWDNSFVRDIIPKEWVSEEFVYKTSSDIDVQDAIFWMYRNGQKAFEDYRFTSRTTDQPDEYAEIHLWQVSGGAGPNTQRYMDVLYVSEDWARVVLMDGPDIRLDLNEGSTFERAVMPCPTISWDEATGEITCHDWRSYLPTATHIGVINSSNELVAVADISGA